MFAGRPVSPLLSSLDRVLGLHHRVAVAPVAEPGSRLIARCHTYALQSAVPALSLAIGRNCRVYGSDSSKRVVPIAVIIMSH